MSSVVADFKDTNGAWIRSYKLDGKQYITKSGLVWKNMMDRCKIGGKVQQIEPTYIGCHTSTMFGKFQTFTDWHVQQIGYEEQRYQLDKDLLVNGNKLYSEDTCVLVPSQLNSFLIACDSARGLWPKGVCFHKATSKFYAQISIGGKRKYLGLHSTPEAAEVVYNAAKQTETLRWYERLRAGEFIVDERVIESIRALGTN